MPRKMTHEEHVKAIAKVNHDVDVLGEITGNDKKVLCRCKVCDHLWLAIPNNLKRGSGCPKCKAIKISQKQTLSHEDQVSAIAKINPDVEVLEKIVNSKTKVACLCNVCNHWWKTTPDDLKHGHGCPKCYNIRRCENRKLSHENQVSAISTVNHDIEVIGEIVNDKTKVLCRCKVCSYEWSATPNNLKRGQGCPKCAKHGFLSHNHGKLYIMVDDPEVPMMMKIGVSIKENKRRNQILKSAHKAGVRIPDLHIVKTLEGPTCKVQELESTIHKVFSDYKINFPVKFNGSNEFFYYSPEVFYMVEEAYKEIVCCQ
ncbi:zinc-ribbon domain-containing protein [Escherichia coli]|uniref:zinc-ribbon domain-containing protein n=1 Tax=Escherichia coli TaxID=562 RepID=UPI0003BEE4BD|nr:GIY-YIG nuclease family protein [Escherichia coli]EKV9481353.1 GIY-YIG nuclease family protein [Escherichia coli]ELI9381918.1 GIY-YIG nuclease family protein [Escherichia coli]ELT7413141.1 GIY-YIG nuclease family protein [Escherichia coli]ESK37470.1 hypothetical protein G966_01489 [Escherichia coli UMEA 3323-1]MCN2150026.1 GIY-YIG nuclease family protein [Escherichia coli]